MLTWWVALWTRFECKCSKGRMVRKDCGAGNPGRYSGLQRTCCTGSGSDCCGTVGTECILHPVHLHLYLTGGKKEKWCWSAVNNFCVFPGFSHNLSLNFVFILTVLKGAFGTEPLYVLLLSDSWSLSVGLFSACSCWLWFMYATAIKYLLALAELRRKVQIAVQFYF